MSLVELVEASSAGGEIAGGKINAEREITTAFSNDELNTALKICSGAKAERSAAVM
jgi:hypothetical protein